MNPSHIPSGYHSMNPYLIVDNAARAMEFYQKAFGAQEVMRLGPPGGKIMHAEVQIGDSKVMFADEVPQMGALSPKSIGGSSVFIALYVENVDEVVARATAAGAQVLRPVQDQFYGDRSGTVQPVRPQVDDCHAQGRRLAGRNRAALCRGNEKRRALNRVKPAPNQSSRIGHNYCSRPSAAKTIYFSVFR